MSRRPLTLFFDIETTPNLCFTWGLGKQWVGYENLYKERQVSAICWKWGNGRRVYSAVLDQQKLKISQKDDDADKELLRLFSQVYAKADLAVGHNGLKFDIATIRARLIRHGLPDIVPLIVDDTYLASKGIRFNSHKLDYLAQYLGLGEKAPHPYSLWKRVVAGDPKALRATVRYCKMDVLLLERVYKRLRPFVKSKLNRAVFASDSNACPSCGARKLQSAGIRTTVSGGTFRRFRCRGCGYYSKQGPRGRFPQ